jgi:hypothetical protein
VLDDTAGQVLYADQLLSPASVVAART